MAGLVFASAKRIEKPGQAVNPDEEIEVRKPLPYVGRGGLKLEEALEVFGIDVAGFAAADLGASTGGFTDCLLQRGARRVYAVDVDTRQLDQKLRGDPRVILIEKNARFLGPADFPENLDLVVMDLSFISVLKVLPAVKTFAGRASIAALLKPQFEAGRAEVGRGKGVVRDPGVHAAVLRRLVGEAAELGFGLRGLTRCSTTGQKGNREFFALWSLEAPSLPLDRIERLIQEVVRNEKN